MNIAWSGKTGWVSRKSIASLLGGENTKSIEFAISDWKVQSCLIGSFFCFWFSVIFGYCYVSPMFQHFSQFSSSGLDGITFSSSLSILCNVHFGNFFISFSFFSRRAPSWGHTEIRSWLGVINDYNDVFGVDTRFSGLAVFSPTVLGVYLRLGWKNPLRAITYYYWFIAPFVYFRLHSFCHCLNCTAFILWLFFLCGGGESRL